jgi:hypothetical protein
LFIFNLGNSFYTGLILFDGCIDRSKIGSL